MSAIRESPKGAPVIDGIEIGERLRVGPGSIVYNGWRAADGQEIVIKVLDDPYVNTETRRRIERQVELLRGRRIPCLPQYYGSIVEDNRLIVISEMVPGLNPVAHAESIQLDLAGRVRLVSSVCDSAQTLHEHGVIHRDLKPSNIVIDHENRAVLIDLDGAKHLDHSTITVDGAGFGTADFSAPEQFDPSIGEVTVRSDVYAIGRVAGVLFGEHRNRRLQAVVAKAAAAAPSDRYATAEAFGADLNRWLSGDSIEAMPSTVRRVWAGARAHWPVTVLAALLTVALLVAALTAGDARASRRGQREAEELAGQIELLSRENHDRAQRAAARESRLLAVIDQAIAAARREVEQGQFAEALSTLNAISVSGIGAEHRDSVSSERRAAVLRVIAMAYDLDHEGDALTGVSEELADLDAITEGVRDEQSAGSD
jgi:predicted Ser/Thr protein kinase